LTHAVDTLMQPTCVSGEIISESEVLKYILTCQQTSVIKELCVMIVCHS